MVLGTNKHCTSPHRTVSSNHNFFQRNSQQVISRSNGSPQFMACLLTLWLRFFSKQCRHGCAFPALTREDENQSGVSRRTGLSSLSPETSLKRFVPVLHANKLLLTTRMLSPAKESACFCRWHHCLLSAAFFFSYDADSHLGRKQEVLFHLHCTESFRGMCGVTRVRSDPCCLAPSPAHLSTGLSLNS